MTAQVIWNADPKALQALIEKAIGPRAGDLELRFRPMFGGIMAYSCDRPFASISNAGIALKLSPVDREALIESGEGYPLRYKPDDPPSKGYTILAEQAYGDDNATLEKWLLQSTDYCQTLPIRKRTRKKR